MIYPFIWKLEKTGYVLMFSFLRKFFGFRYLRKLKYCLSFKISSSDGVGDGVRVINLGIISDSDTLDALRDSDDPT